MLASSGVRVLGIKEAEVDLPVRWFVVVLPARLRAECEREKFNKVTRKQDSQSNDQSDGASAAVTFFDGGEDFCCTSSTSLRLLKLSVRGKSKKRASLRSVFVVE